MMSDFQKIEMQVVFERLLNVLHAEGCFQNCTKCFYWKTEKEICNKFNQRPPARIIVKGCQYFELDEIPF